jgi:hypothetical protein
VPRRLATLAAVASLLLCVATLALWVRSYWVADSVDWYRVWWGETPNQSPWTTYRYAYVTSARGGLSVKCAVEEFDHYPHELMPGGGLRHEVSEKPKYPAIDPADPWVTMPVLLSLGGFQLCYERTDDLPRYRQHSFRFTLPMWFLFCATMLPAPWMAARRKRQRRRERGQCSGCGYDLRATPGRCPECGAVPAAPAAR